MSLDGKLYDAYISYVNNDHDRKFVTFILKPHLENKIALKVHLNDNDILPGSGKIDVCWSLYNCMFLLVHPVITCYSTAGFNHFCNVS